LKNEKYLEISSIIDQDEDVYSSRVKSEEFLEEALIVGKRLAQNAKTLSQIDTKVQVEELIYALPITSAKDYYDLQTSGRVSRTTFSDLLKVNKLTKQLRDDSDQFDRLKSAAKIHIIDEILSEIKIIEKNIK